MKVILTHETRFKMDQNGNVFTNNEHSSGYNYFKKYLDVFDSVVVMGRLKKEVTTTGCPVTGEGVSFFPLPYYLGPTQYLMKAMEMKKAIQGFFLNQKLKNSFIARTPGNIGSILIKELSLRQHPFGMEVVSDPYDVFAPGAIKHPLRPFFRIIGSQKLKHQCSKASAVSYVTEFALQKRYPPAKESFSTHYSSIQMEDKAFIDSPRTCKRKFEHEIIFVGTLAQLYKAPDILIDAVERCTKIGTKLRLSIVGDGKLRKELERRVALKNLDSRIHFLGALPSGEAVRNRLDRADLFVLPSRGEGLPRAMIEAMARGLPCIGSTASGIPELLPADDLVPPEDVASLAKKISEVVQDPDRMTRMSSRNLEKSKEYKSELLQKRRIEFYQTVKEKTEFFYRNMGF